MQRRHASAVFISATLALASLPAWAVSETYSEGSIYFGNSYPSSTYVYSQAQQTQSTPGATSQADLTRTFTGTGGTAGFTGHAQALSDFGTLKAEASYSLTNAIAKSPGDPAYVAEDFTLDTTNGVPDTYGAYAVAFFRDTVTVTGAPSVSSLTFSLHLTGSLDNGGLPNFDQFIAVRQNNGGGGPFSGGFSDIYYTSSEGTYDLHLVSNAITVTGGQASFGFMLETQAGIQITADKITFFGTEYTGNTDFYSTLSLGEVSGFDAGGAQVALSSVLGGTGLSYQVSAVPEPGTLVMMVAGLAALPLVRRRRSPRA